MVYRQENVTLLDALDTVLEKGAVIAGDIAIRMADVDLVYLGLRLILTSVSKAEEMSGRRMGSHSREPLPEDYEELERLQSEIRKAEENIPRFIDAANPKETEKGIAKLVLALVELIRKLMQREAMRRVKKGTLAPFEVQKLGLSLKAVQKKIEEVRAVFGLKEEDLNIDLGPLGNLI